VDAVINACFAKGHGTNCFGEELQRASFQNALQKYVNNQARKAKNGVRMNAPPRPKALPPPPTDAKKSAEDKNAGT